MKTGDKVKINPATCSYSEALIELFGGDSGHVLKVVEDDYVIVYFPTGYKMIAQELLDVVNESR